MCELYPVPKHLAGWRHWWTPNGRMWCRMYEMYRGIRGQIRIGLVDEQGRVHHFDASLMR